MKTTVRHNKDIKPTWYIIDAKDQILGRISTKVAMVLRGKHKADYTPHVTAGDYVVVINSAHIKLTGAKWDQKLYRTHSGYPGHLKETTAAKKHADDPTFLLRDSIKGMLRHNRLRASALRRLKVFPGAEHAHTAQNPKELKA